MEENKNETNVIGEENLEEVAGGTGLLGRDCYFKPEYPFEHRKSHGAIWVLCRSSCYVGTECSCRGSVYCEGKWHMMDQDTSDPKVWYAKPRNSYNHSAKDKVVQPLEVN